MALVKRQSRLKVISNKIFQLDTDPAYCISLSKSRSCDNSRNRLKLSMHMHCAFRDLNPGWNYYPTGYNQSFDSQHEGFLERYRIYIKYVMIAHTTFRLEWPMRCVICSLSYKLRKGGYDAFLCVTVQSSPKSWRSVGPLLPTDMS